MPYDMLEAALKYHALGWSVIPVGSNKTPRLAWVKYQSERASEGEIRAWWARWPDANIGIVTGRGSGIIVVDADGDDGQKTLDSLELGDPTPVARTGGGGSHAYYAFPKDLAEVHNFARKLPGLDLRGDGGYVIAPPSMHASGHRYTWLIEPDRQPPASAPAWLISLITESPGGAPAPAITDRIPKGQRNTSLSSLGGTMRRRGASTAEILAALEVANAARCDPPLTAGEVQRIAQSVGRYKPVVTPTPGNLHLTDLGNAGRLVARHGGDLRYCYPWTRWLAWDGRRWAIDEVGEVKRRAKETVRAIYAEAADLADESERKRRASWAMRSESRHRLDAMIALAQSEPAIPVLPDDLDADRWLLTVNNGTLDLQTGNLRPHDPNDRITHLAEVDYDPHAKPPLWLSFLTRVMGGNDDLIAFLQRAVGYSLTGDTGERVLFFLYGCGANGKSTFLETIRAMTGDYGLRTPTETLLAKRDGTIPNDVARLRGARLVTAAEAEEGKRLAETLVKDITGGDTISARFLWAEWFDFRPQCKIWLATNHKPTVRGTDKAIWDRIKLIPFRVTIPEDEQDKRLPEKLKAELPGILAWAVQGCLEWQRDGLGIPSEVKDATASYQDEMDVLGAFLADRCEFGPTSWETVRDLYDAYKDWCEANGEKSISKRAFGLRLAERGLDQYRTGQARGWVGIRLKDGESRDVNYDV